MKRIISMVLAIFMVASVIVTGPMSLVAVADEASEIFEVQGEATYNFGATFSGYLRVSADLYLTTDGSYAEMVVCHGGVAGKSKFADAKIKNRWQTVSVYLSPGVTDGLKFISTDLMLVNNIKVDKIPEKQLIYEDNFETYLDGEKVNAENYTKIYMDRSNVKLTGEAAVTEFKAVHSAPENETKAGTLYYPRFSYSDATTGAMPVRTDDSGNILNPQPEKLPLYEETIDGKIWHKIPEGMEYYSVKLADLSDKTHVVVELDVYNAANSWAPGTTDINDENTSAIKDALVLAVGRTDSVHTQATEMACAKLGAESIVLTGRTIDNKTGTGVDKVVSHNALPKKWNTVIYEVEREQYDSDGNGIIESTDKWHVTSTVTYGGVTEVNHTYSAYAQDFGRVFLNLDHEYGGRFYIDNLKVYFIDNIENKYITRYEENFDTSDYQTGVTPTGFAFSDATKSDTTQYTTFTVEEGLGGNSTKLGRLYNKGYTYTGTDLKRYKDDGISDGDAGVASGSNKEYFTISVPGLEATNADYVGMKKKTRLSFKYYLADGAKTESKKLWYTTSTNQDTLRVGLMVNRLNNDLESTGMVKIDTISENKATVFGKTDGKAQSSSLSTNAGAIKWVPVEIEIDSVCSKNGMDGSNFNRSYSHEVKYSVGTVSQAMSFQAGCYDINRLMFGIDPTYGGIVYIDDIKVETNVTDSDIDVANAYYENIYLKSFDIGSSNITEMTELSGPSVIVYGKNNNTYTYSAKVVNLNGEEQNAEITYSFEGDVPEGISLSGSTITVHKELPKDTQITLKAEILGTNMVATKKIILQDGDTYAEDKGRFDVLLNHIDNIYNYAGDKINGLPLLGFVIDRANMAPGYWMHKENGEKIEYVPSDLASMGNFLRAVDTVGFITGDESYNEKVNDIYELWLEKYMGDNGLPYWGSHTSANILTGGKDWGSNSSHELKNHYPYMEPFFRVNPKAAQQICIQAWGEHIKDWDTMHFNRHGRYVTSAAENEKEFLEKTEKYTLTDPGYKAVKSTDIGFASIAGDLGQLASALIKNSNGYDSAAKNAFINISDAMWKVCDPDPNKLLNISQNSTAGRYGYDAVDEVLDISNYEPAVSQGIDWWDLPDISLNHYALTTTVYGDRWWNAYGDDMISQGFITEDQQWIVRECFSKFSAGEEASYPFFQWDFVEAAGPETEEGRIVLERALRAHANHIRMAYDKETNKFDTIFIDGTNVTGFEMTRTFYGSTKGSKFNQYDAGYAHLLGTVYNYLNAVRYEEYNDESVYSEFERDKNILWEYIQNYMSQKGFGNLGTTKPGEDIALNYSRAGSDPRIMLSMIYLYQATGITDYLDMARTVGDNIIKSKMVDGMFTELPQNRYIFIGGENGTYPYAFALLEATIRGEEAKVPVYFPNSGFREDVYYDEDSDIEYVTRYSGYVYDKAYSGLETSVEDFKQIQVRNETKTVTFDSDSNLSAEANIKAILVSGSVAEIKVYNNEGKQIHSAQLDPTIKNRRQNINISARGESIKSISFTTDGLVLVDSIIIEKFYKANTLLYEEDFENFEQGEKVYTYDDKNCYDDKYIRSTFTAAENVGDNSSMAGCIYNSGYYFPELYIVDDNGEKDNNAIKTPEFEGSASDAFFINVKEINDHPNLRLEFKYYIGGNSRVQDVNGAPRDTLRVGIVPTRLEHLYASEVAWASLTHNSAGINNRTYNESSESYASSTIARANNNGEKQWHDAAFEVKRIKKMVGGEEKLCAEIALIVDGEKISSVVENIEDSPYGNIVLAAHYYYGGKVYVDDIKLYSLSDADGDTENILGKNFVKLKGAPCSIIGVDGFENLKAGDLSSVILRKSSNALDNLSILTALYQNNVLKNAVVNQVSLSGMELYKDTKVNLNEIITVPENYADYTASIMLSESMETLIPLANRFDIKAKETSE